MNTIQFDFSTSQRIIFGSEKLNELPKVVEELGKNVFILRTPSEDAFLHLVKLLEGSKKEWTSFTVAKEPCIVSIEKAINEALAFKTDFVIALGGGSVIDTGKAVSAMLTNPGQLLDYLEVVGRGLPLKKKAAQLIAIPTTAGTGSEVTRNAVIDIVDKKVKVSLRSSQILPAVALVDPKLTFSVPPNVTAYSGMDAFIQVIEPFVSLKANPMTDMFCREGIKKAAMSLLSAFENGDDLPARENMSWVSLLGGLCLANAGLGAVHGFAGSIGGMFHAPHGAICASLLTAVMEINLKALKSRDKQNQALKRYEEISQLVTNDPSADIYDGINWFMELSSKLEIPKLNEFRISENEFPQIIQQSKLASSMKANPIALSDEELNEILLKAYK